MGKVQIIGEKIPNLPWEERPKGCNDVVWRYSKNPIIKRNHIKRANSIFNSAVVTFNGKFAGVLELTTKQDQ